MGFLWWVLILPVIDLILVWRIASRLQGGLTFLWLALAALLGWLVLRTRGFEGRRAKGSRPQGFLERALVLLAALLLIWPGPLTDVLGVALLLPSVRRRALEALGRRFTGGEGAMGWFGRRVADDEAEGEPGEPGPRSGETHGQFPGARDARDVDFQPAQGPAGRPR